MYQTAQTNFKATSTRVSNYRLDAHVPRAPSIKLDATQCATPRLLTGGESGIRTRDTLSAYTRFPIVLLQPLGQLSNKSF